MQAKRAAKTTSNRYERYQDDPAGYARDILHVEWTPKQVEIAESVRDNPRTMVKASHTVGKTFVGGGIVNWHYDCFRPSTTLTTAPTDRQVRGLLWREIRLQRAGRGDLLPKAASMSDADDHYALGYTASSDAAFQGVHEHHLLILADEAVGIALPIWEAIDGMLSSGDGNRFLAIYNPTDASSAAYAYETARNTNVITVSALDHPNIAAQLAGLPKPYPKAIDLSWIEDHVYASDWCTPINAEDHLSTDIEWPPGSGEWFRPGPDFESRVLGRWPSQAFGSVWSVGAFEAACDMANQQPEPTDIPCEIGCDVARFGDDRTVIHVHRGPVSLYHESHNGWGTDQTNGRLKELANEYGQRCGVDGRQIMVKVDDDGVGGGVIDHRDGYSFVGIGAGSSAIEPERYPNRRSELWFAVANRALRPGGLDLTRLPLRVQQELRRQALAPSWKQNGQGQRVVEPKADTKKRLNRSPDDMDALNLAYAFAPPAAGASVDVVNVRAVYGPDRSNMHRFGGRR